MLSFKNSLILFLIGLINLGLGFFGNLSDRWTLICVGIGLGIWFILMIWMFVERTFLTIHHFKRLRKIRDEYKTDKSEEEKQVIQRGSSQALKQARKKRIKLWIDSLLGVKD